MSCCCAPSRQGCALILRRSSSCAWTNPTTRDAWARRWWLCSSAARADVAAKHEPGSGMRGLGGACPPWSVSGSLRGFSSAKALEQFARIVRPGGHGTRDPVERWKFVVGKERHRARHRLTSAGHAAAGRSSRPTRSHTSTRVAPVPRSQRSPPSAATHHRRRKVPHLARRRVAEGPGIRASRSARRRRDSSAHPPRLAAKRPEQQWRSPYRVCGREHGHARAVSDERPET